MVIGSLAWRLALVRRILKISPLRVTREEAIERAQEAWIAQRGGQGFSQPVAVEELRRWHVWLMRDGTLMPWVDIDGQTGEVLGLGMPPL